jgi:hypothetical protein
MRLVFPTRRLFKPNSLEVRRLQHNFLPKIAKIVGLDLRSTPVDVSFTVDSRTYLQPDLQTNTTLDILRAGYLTHELLSGGMSKFALKGGVAASRDGNITIDFTVHYGQ